MIDLISTINVVDVNAFVEGAKSVPQDRLSDQGVVEQTIYQGIGQNVVMISNTYKTLEDAQQHKTMLESPEFQAVHEQMGVESFDIWLVEKHSTVNF